MANIAYLVSLLLSVAAPLCAASSQSDAYNEYMASLNHSNPVFENNFGSAYLLRAQDLPGLKPINYAVELLTVQACSAVAPHYHPDANQLVHVISGSFVHTQFINGTRHQQLLDAGTVSTTPAGTIHGVSNPSCEAVSVLVAFSNSGFSRTPPITQLAGMPPHLLAATFGVEDPSAFTAAINPPTPMVYPLGDAACTAWCAGTLPSPQQAQHTERGSQQQQTLQPQESTSEGGEAGDNTCAGADAHADSAASSAASTAEEGDPFNGDLRGAPSIVDVPQGSVQALTGADLPGLALTGNSLFLVQLHACSLLLPHFHPDAHEIVFVREGQVEAFLHVGSQRSVHRQLAAGDVVALPKGSLHSFANRGCGEVELYAVLDNASPALTLPAAELLGQDDRELQASFGVSEEDFQEWRAGIRGAGGVLAPLLDKACTARCGLVDGVEVAN